MAGKKTKTMKGCGMKGGAVKKAAPKKTKGVIMLDKSVTPMVRTDRYFGTMVDRVLPAARPLVQIGDAQHGDLFIR